MQTKRTILITAAISLSFLVAAVSAEEGKKPIPDGRLQLSGGSVAAGIGFSWGKGTLTFKGKEYPIKVDGLSAGSVGVTSVEANGEVYNLHKIEDFNGNYTAAAAGATLAGGGSAVTMANQNGVKVDLRNTTQGVSLTIGVGGIRMEVKQ